MLIEVDFQEILNLMLEFTIINTYEISTDKRGFSEGFIKGNIIFQNKSYLHFREFIDVEIMPDRKMYSYQYMSANDNLTGNADKGRGQRAEGRR